MRRLGTLLFAAGLFVLPGSATADPIDSVSVDETTQGTSGRSAVNLAAGNDNQQANVAVIAIGDVALATANVSQSLGGTAVDRAGRREAFIRDGAFEGSRGLTAVNIASGNANQQANIAVIGIGLEGAVLSDVMLSQSHASSQPKGELDPAIAGEIATGIDPGAFADSSGLVQVSLIGGEANTSANVFALSVSASVKP